MIDLSLDQNKALESLYSWQKAASGGSITLGGYAGTGKTTLISILRKKIHEEQKKKTVAFASFTGKASRVLAHKLQDNQSIYKKDVVGTIHSLIYSPLVNSKEEIIGWTPKESLPFDLVIIDEASMVDENIWKDLTSYGVPIIAVGDHGQLPPINGQFNLMKSPELTLLEIHRQAKGNPIIQISIYAREKGVIPFGAFGSQVKKIKRTDVETEEIIEHTLNSYKKDTLILCGYNTTRVRINTFIRSSLDRNPSIPVKGDRVICLRNNHKTRVFNGMLGEILAIENKDMAWYKAEIKMDGEKNVYKGLIAREQFGANSALNFTQKRGRFMRGDLFDFGYALTVHKAQGSQAKKVVLFEERFGKSDEEMWRRWLYTAVTRAEEELLIFG
ncbi:MAG: hypothetical protein A2700_01260 [Candidatus Blackburnbacteria bacterium RIFCSPHIGHO2_01_FULL_44_64]|uniref:UvrD-like helicase C-terminal domain-containing protein n=1 Tax=Candidatus Blackburnbacteria bacterium RIFCSPHIGHO2_02_FULL_44_20 TaxID=1797516 RepID=A0A1G1V6H7_9BACT|nr:MAG: hypothetical protein A2700_01260 [Candidatus Blackburnbacteria bacterium RIFCSPHIGHO2_01_FULL_44_64]OGY10712.1 MAG: hypothetical protein A3E16_01795 [Candidatus Blackburnbacteria bacterium RIFCSPHIGHO2_12_FULL_44_25]OGY11014.1 MAG: hypothetical protein A3D26_03805 [Candidatus Blackburnbacteria bacterium RIFCSPHIGHO2_02_FULL_44_20]OGY15208.1 MAG: hypothetical protein A3A62_02555 [Candidatus Blackburnbacteria bacterium RIFCSPLOWO2_01_FULL_44_43]OGY15844.1 MAG: hypothetical protein A3H88_0